MKRANYVVTDRRENWIRIQDLGPWDEYLTVTNAAEDVVEELINSGDLLPGQRLFYFDSEGNRDEILILDGKFGGFVIGEAPKGEKR